MERIFFSVLCIKAWKKYMAFAGPVVVFYDYKFLYIIDWMIYVLIKSWIFMLIVFIFFLKIYWEYVLVSQFIMKFIGSRLDERNTTEDKIICHFVRVCLELYFAHRLHEVAQHFYEFARCDTGLHNIVHKWLMYRVAPQLLVPRCS